MTVTSNGIGIGDERSRCELSCRYERDLRVTQKAEEWGRLNVPDPLPVIDGLIAATAKVRSLTLVTRNVADVARTGVDSFNPWGT